MTHATSMTVHIMVEAHEGAQFLLDGVGTPVTIMKALTVAKGRGYRVDCQIHMYQDV